MDLNSAKCIPCQVGDTPLENDEIKVYLEKVRGWVKEENPPKIVKEFEFENFKSAISFVNKIADLAESEGHHPNIYIHDFKKVSLELYTHKIGGLHKNDFIMASKIDRL